MADTPERLQKYLSECGVCSRRKAEELIAEGKVKINGKVASKSTPVKVGDIIEVAFGERILKAEIVSVAEHVLKADAQSMYKPL